MRNDTIDDLTPDPWKLWFGILAGPIAWSVHFLFSYFLIDAICTFDIIETYGIFDWPNLTVVAATFIAFGVGVVAGVIAYQSWQQLEEDEEELIGRGEDRRQFMALLGILLSGLFSLAILGTGIPSLFLRPCL